MSTGKNRRRHRRVPCINPIRISWEEQSQDRFALCKCIDISETGLRIESPYPVQARTVIILRSERIELHGSGVVRHVVRHGSKYLLGVQLNQAILGGVIAELEGRNVSAVLIENLNRTDQNV
jgi:hypothetical protein